MTIIKIGDQALFSLLIINYFTYLLNSVFYHLLSLSTFEKK